ncbi:hypothetical protein BJ508DRAFT_315585 [Ascobolus immersus RN42]|uniref:Uncharacterized protein n=1 Tax=Ascobolus immersus RN42 TaxID=1160509 RepID=A0A3N4HHF2_ASCIM|nr:hypothetical protein BJ508DRAFT_315585 [Ascobolus immersus RN42]
MSPAPKRARYSLVQSHAPAVLGGKSPAPTTTFLCLPHEIRLLISEHITQWRDHIAYRQMDRTNHILLTSTYRSIIERQFRMEKCVQEAIDSFMVRAQSGYGLSHFIVSESGSLIPQSGAGAYYIRSSSGVEDETATDTFGSSKESKDLLHFMHRNNIHSLLQTFFAGAPKWSVYHARAFKEVQVYVDDFERVNKRAGEVLEQLNVFDMPYDVKCITHTFSTFVRALTLLRSKDTVEAEITTVRCHAGDAYIVLYWFVLKEAIATISKLLARSSLISHEEGEHYMQGANVLASEIEDLFQIYQSFWV